MCCSAAAFSVVIDLLSWYGRISWSGRETNATAMPVVVVVVFFYGVVAGSSVFLRWGGLDDIHCIKARVVWGDEEANSNSSWYTTHSKEEERERTKITTPTHQSANTSSCWSQTAPRFAGRRPWWRRRASRPRNRRIATECLWEKKMSFFSFFFFEAKCLPSFLCSQ